MMTMTKMPKTTNFWNYPVNRMLFSVHARISNLFGFIRIVTGTDVHVDKFNYGHNDEIDTVQIYFPVNDEFDE